MDCLVHAPWKRVGCNNLLFVKSAIILNKSTTTRRKWLSNWTGEAKNVWNPDTLTKSDLQMQIYYTINHRRITVKQMQARGPSGLRDVSATFPRLKSTVVSCCVVGVVTTSSRSRLREIVTVYFFGVVKLNVRSVRRLSTCTPVSKFVLAWADKL